MRLEERPDSSREREREREENRVAVAMMKNNISLLGENSLIY